MTSQEEFKAASTWLSSTPAAANLPNNIKLELYGLFKFIGTEAGPSESRPSIFSPAPRAKHDAWTAQASKYSSNGSAEARARYVEIAKTVGWNGEGLDEDDEEEDLSDLSGDESPKKSKGKAKATGMGVSVSVMAQPEDEEGDDEPISSPIHEAVISDSFTDVATLLEKDPTLVNARDEFGYTPLHLAADRDLPVLVQYLVDAGADKDAKDADDQTALELAEASGRDDVVKILR